MGRPRQVERAIYGLDMALIELGCMDALLTAFGTVVERAGKMDRQAAEGWQRLTELKQTIRHHIEEAKKSLKEH